MDQVQQGTKTREASRHGSGVIPAVLAAVVVVALVAVAIFAMSRNGSGTHVQPASQPGLFEFLRSEHAAAAAQVLPAGRAGLFEFLRSEHAEGDAQIQSANQPGLFEFLRSERTLTSSR